MAQRVARNILLLTATINPPNTALALARTQADTRLRDYLDALDSHLNLLAQGKMDALVFVENSNSDLSPLREAIARRGLTDHCELIGYWGLDYPPLWGRAYGECRILDHAMSTSRFIAEAAPDARIWKVTGRYIVRNFPELLEHCPARFDLYCNMRDYPKRWVDMYLLGWTKRGYETYLRDVASELRVLPETPQGLSPEQLLRNLLEARKGAGGLVPRFAKTPILDGIRGYDNRSYAEVNRWRNLVRRAAQHVMPWLWI